MPIVISPVSGGGSGTSAPLASPQFTGAPTVPTPPVNDSSTRAANTAFVAAVAATKASSDSPTLTGVPKAPTAAAGTNTTQVATTAFVAAAVGSGGGGGGASFPGVPQYVVKAVNGVYPTRPSPSTAVSYEWQGPTQPQRGGDYAMIGVDTYTATP